MNRRERKNLVEDIEERLDNDLDFDLEYEIEDYHSEDVSIVDANITEDDDYPDDWDSQVEDIFNDIADDWGGWYSWDGWCISISIPD